MPESPPLRAEAEGASVALTETLVSQKRLACEFRGGSLFLLQSYHFETPSLSAITTYGTLQKQSFLKIRIFYYPLIISKFMLDYMANFS